MPLHRHKQSSSHQQTHERIYLWVGPVDGSSRRVIDRPLEFASVLFFAIVVVRKGEAKQETTENMFSFPSCGDIRHHERVFWDDVEYPVLLCIVCCSKRASNWWWRLLEGRSS